MDGKLITRSRFRRANDRRISGVNPETDLRLRKHDRRQAGPSWLALFHDIDETLITEIINDFEVLSLPAGTLLLKPGDENQCVYLVLSGTLVAHFESEFTPDAALPIKPGECIGEFSAIDGKPVSAYVLALHDSRVLHIQPENFWNQLMPIPGVARNLLVSLTERMRRTNEAALDAHRKQLDLQYIKQELEVARQLQAGMLPLRHPMFPERCEIEIAGMMEPATEIGGDLFDAFFIDTHMLFLSIGDVSGHGIPAALFMARIVGLMRISAMATTRPDHLLERINSQLCEGNDANMFVTLFCGFLNIETGHFIYSNAGHCAPLLVRQDSITRLPLPKGPLVGVLSNVQYMTNEVYLDGGDTVICFTDGVTEAQTAVGEEFSEGRLLEIIRGNRQKPLPELLNSVRHAVAEFTNHKTLDDDCTMLALRQPHL